MAALQTHRTTEPCLTLKHMAHSFLDRHITIAASYDILSISHACSCFVVPEHHRLPITPGEQHISSHCHFCLRNKLCLIKAVCRAAEMHKRSGHCLGPPPLSAEPCIPAQIAAIASQQQLLSGSPAQNSNCCSLPLATGPEAVHQHAASSPASPAPSALCHDHTWCQADICCKAPATPLIPHAHHDRRPQYDQTNTMSAVPPHAQRASPNQSSHSQPLSPFQSCQLPAGISLSSGGRTCEADQKLLWWPLDHVTMQGSRLAVGDSCYIITGHCVVCGVNNELDMVECTPCKRFTHFACACPQLTQAPQVPYLFLLVTAS